MTDRGVARLAWSIYAASVAILGTGVVVGLTGGGPGLDMPDVETEGVIVVTFGLVGALIASRHRGTVLGWLLLAAAFVESLTVTSGAVAMVAVLDGRPSDAGWPAWVWSWTTPPIFPAGLICWIVLLFPDGRLPGRRWRWVLGAAVVYSAIATVLVAIDTTPIELSSTTGSEREFVANPAGMVDLGGVIDPLWLPGLVILLASVVGLVLRQRRARGLERQQLKWFVYVVAATCVAIVALNLVALTVGEDAFPEWLWFVPIVGGLAVGIPVAFAVAILGHGLYEIDVVIRKTVVYALFAAFATAAYAALVVGIGTWVGRESSFLTTAAAVAVAITFHPVRQRLIRVADRLVYGKRATPYEVLSEFSERVGETYATSDLLPRMAAVLGEGTGATRADVWLKVGEELRPTSSWPANAPHPDPLPLTDGDLPTLPYADIAYPVRHQGELLGALALAKPPSDPLSPTDEKLVSDLAAQAGLVLRNARLTTELEGRIDELRALQKRLVSAQDGERRRLERNIHDGAQQQLVALTVRLRLAEGIVDKDPAKARTMLADLQGETQSALEDLRDLARGIYPPLLADKGLAAALEAQARKSVVPADVSADGVGRHPEEVEAAIYFSVLEALQNVAKYADATRASIKLATSNGDLTFEVEDDGRGFDTAASGYGTGLQGIADRLAALDGSVEVRSTPGDGTVVRGRIPLAEVHG